MNKTELKKNFWNLADEREKEKYIFESASALFGYIRTGSKNILLEEMVSLESEFNERYKVRMSKDAIRTQIYGFINDSYKDYMQNCCMSAITTEKDGGETALAETIKKVIEVVYTKTTEFLGDSLVELIRDTSYLSHMNMLYELYEKQEKLQREEKEYEELSKRFTAMAKIAEMLSKEKRMELIQLRKKMNLTEKQMDALLTEGNSFFNMRKKQQSVQVSLTADGRKFLEYCLKSEGGMSNEKMNGLIYKNCDKLMNAIEISYSREIKYDLQLDGLNPDKEEAIKFKYNRLVDDMLDYKWTGSYYFRKEKRRKNERNEYRIPRKWDSRFFEDVY